jgi:uncharacterized membrane protein YdbT with pleckstrin-like domain
LVSSSRRVSHGVVVWSGKPWVIPAAIFRTAAIVITAIIVLFLEMNFGFALIVIAGLPVFMWTLLIFVLIWVLGLLNLLIFWASHIYVLRQDGLEVRRGIIQLHSFVVTPSGFGDLAVFQSFGGQIFGYGDLTINSQGERHTKLALVRAPYVAADIIRDIMGKPIVRIDAKD